MLNCVSNDEHVYLHNVGYRVTYFGLNNGTPSKDKVWGVENIDCKANKMSS